VGTFTANMTSIATGDPSLMNYILGDYLRTKKYGEAQFDFQVSDVELTYGIERQLTIPGTFKMMGKKASLDALAKFTPILTQEGVRKTLCSVEMTIPIEDPWGLKGPDGPEEAKNKVNLIIHFIIQ
ncbi:MAG: YceI family protein, partial [Bacteroidota bacterium]